MRRTWIEDIAAVVEHGSITAAAEAGHVSQSAFSRRIAGIEAAIGVAIVDRTRRSGALHADVAPLAQRFCAVAREIRQVRAALQVAAGRSAGVIVSAQHALSTLLATPLVRRIGPRAGPGGLRLHAGDREDCAAMVLRGEADIAILYRDGAVGAIDPVVHVEAVDLSSDLFLPVGRGEATTAAGLTDLSVVSYPDDAFLGRLFVERVIPRLAPGTVLRSRAQTALTLTALQLAIDGVGVAWVPARLARPALEAATLINLAHRLPVAALKVYAMRRRDGVSAHADLAWRALTEEGALPDGFE